jgi:chromosome segregation ATPase
LRSINDILQHFPDENYSDDKDEYQREKEKVLSNTNYHIDKIKDLANDIDNITKGAKDNGIHNEQQLYLGKEQITDLKNTLNNLERQLEDIDNENSNLSYDIDDIQNIIEDVKNKISDTTTASVSRLKKLGKGFNFICEAHDDIMNLAMEILNECYNLEDIEKEYDEILEIISEIEDRVGGIEYAMQQAVDMNNRMGNSIDGKNNILDDLLNQIKDKESELENNNNSNIDLKDKLSELEELLSQLEDQIN